MGNERSQPSGLIVEEKSFLSDNFWTLHSATYGKNSSQRVTVFESTTQHAHQTCPLEKFAKNLMVHRHPNIVKYVAAWRLGEKYFLATEEVSTLPQVFHLQSSLQICIGLHSILKAVHFLHEKALSSHNNICQASIYVTPEGHWKLGGMENLCRFSDLNARFLSESRSIRYDRAISPRESTRVPQPLSAIDQYAYGILVEEVLTPKANEEVPGLVEFLALCKNKLQATECSLRTPFGTLLEHAFFNHEFITIHNFLSDLPLKSEVEKQTFFRGLSCKLREYNERVVASHFSTLLLSRIVLLDSTAQQYLLPEVLIPRTDDKDGSLFSESTYREFIVPKLMSIFCVRDVQVRLTLLTHFKGFCGMFNQTQLSSRILPELLVGIKDLNNELVACTLRALADLVPLLGSATVIGGKRGKHFSDGRPKIIRHLKTKKNAKVKGIDVETTSNPLEEGEIFLHERPSPDGGEAPSTTTETDEEIEAWDSWDVGNNMENENLPISLLDTEIGKEEPVLQMSSSTLDILRDPSPIPPTPVSSDSDLNSLDVKANSVKSAKHSLDTLEDDFFRDMEPVISKAQIHEIPTKAESSPGLKTGFDVDINSDGDGWGEEWPDVDDEVSLSAPSIDQ